MSQSHIRIRGAPIAKRIVTRYSTRQICGNCRAIRFRKISPALLIHLVLPGQRRYVRTHSGVCPSVLSHNGKPEVDSIEGLSPAIAVEQRIYAITHVQRLAYDYRSL